VPAEMAADETAHPLAEPSDRSSTASPAMPRSTMKAWKLEARRSPEAFCHLCQDADDEEVAADDHNRERRAQDALEG